VADIRSEMTVESPLLVFLIQRKVVDLAAPTGASTEKDRERWISTRLLIGTDEMVVSSTLPARIVVSRETVTSPTAPALRLSFTAVIFMPRPKLGVSSTR
jgi:hypothetical protein